MAHSGNMDYKAMLMTYLSAGEEDEELDIDSASGVGKNHQVVVNSQKTGNLYWIMNTCPFIKI